MSRTTHKRIVFLAALFALLIYSIDAYHYIPFWSFWGFDLHNLVAFHNCEFRNNPYAAGTSFCGDAGGRAMFYPPLLYWSFFWTRGLELKTANWIWSVANVVGMLACYSIWCKIAKTKIFAPVNALFWLLLLPQYPFFFTIERGNSDVPSVLLWSIGAYLLTIENFFLAGFIFSTALLYKLYPVIPLAIIGLGFLVSVARGSAKDRKNLLTFVSGIVMPVMFQLLVSFEQTKIYFLTVLPTFASKSSDLGVYSHSIKPLDEYIPGAAAVIKAMLFLGWCFLSVRIFKKDLPLLLAGTIAISTFLGNTAYEYNLITCYPFLLLLIFRANSLKDYLWTFLGVALMVGHRAVWPTIDGLAPFPLPYLKILLEVSWLILSVPLILQGICSTVPPDAESVK